MNDAISSSGNSVNSCIAKVVDIRAALSDEMNRKFFPTALVDDRNPDQNVSNMIRKIRATMPAFTFSEAPQLVERSIFDPI